MTLKSQWNLPQNGFYWGWLRYQMGSTDASPDAPYLAQHQGEG